MSIFNDALDRIENNRHSNHNCIPFTKIFPRFSEHISGIQKSRYYLVSGSSGAGKSQFTDHTFVFTPYDFLQEEKTDLSLKIFYYSFELDKQTKLTQWMSRRLYDVYGIRTGINILQSIGKNRLSQDLYMAVLETRKYFESLEDIIIISDEVKRPDEIKKEIHEYANKNGKSIYKELTIKEPDGSVKEVKVFDKYISNNPKEYVEIIVDHYSLLNVPRGSTIKMTIEELSSAFVQFRNKYSYIPIGIQQQSAAKEDVEHVKANRLEPSKDGLAESKLTYNDCDIALGIFSPQRHDIKKYRDYDITQMGDSYRNINVFKNRYGAQYLNLGLYFDGAVTYFKELPQGKQTGYDIYEKVKNRKPDW